jgi:hypothetical protein
METAPTPVYSARLQRGELVVHPPVDETDVCRVIYQPYPTIWPEPRHGAIVTSWRRPDMPTDPSAIVAWWLREFPEAC